jgi:hypothetical protein
VARRISPVAPDLTDPRPIGLSLNEEVEMNDRVFRLLETHQRIDKALRNELKRRWPDPHRTIYLKKLKLRVKDLMLRLSRRTATS